MQEINSGSVVSAMSPVKLEADILNRESVRSAWEDTIDCAAREISKGVAHDEACSSDGACAISCGPSEISASTSSDIYQPARPESPYTMMTRAGPVRWPRH